jgi:hypothetical protein
MKFDLHFLANRFVAAEQLANDFLIHIRVVCGLLVLLFQFHRILTFCVAFDLTLKELLHAFSVLVKLQLLVLNVRGLDATLHFG